MIFFHEGQLYTGSSLTPGPFGGPRLLQPYDFDPFANWDKLEPQLVRLFLALQKEGEQFQADMLVNKLTHNFDGLIKQFSDELGTLPTDCRALARQTDNPYNIWRCAQEKLEKAAQAHHPDPESLFLNGHVIRAMHFAGTAAAWEMVQTVNNIPAYDKISKHNLADVRALCAQEISTAFPTYTPTATPSLPEQANSMER